MPSQVADISPVMKQLSVVVEGPVVTKELDKAYKKKGDSARIPGFRQGKIPRQVLERYFRQEVESDVLNRLLSNAYREALLQHKVDPVAHPQINVGEYIPGQDFSFTAKVEVKPAIELKDYKGLPATRTSIEVTEGAVEQAIEARRQRAAVVVPVENRDVIQAGDLCTSNFTGTVDGVEFRGGQGNAYVLEAGGDLFAKPLQDALIGKKMGETHEIDVTLPAEFRANKEMGGKNAHFRVTVTELRTRQLPALDDDFAKDLGDYESLADLRTKLRAELEENAKEESESKVKDALITHLIERNPFDLPPSLVEQQIDARLYSMLGRLNPEQLRRLGLDRQKMREDQREISTRQVRANLLLEALAKAESLAVTDDEMEANFVRMAARSNQPVQRVRAMYQGERREELRAHLRIEKALDFLVQNANIQPG